MNKLVYLAEHAPVFASGLASSNSLATLNICGNNLDNLEEHTEAFTHAIASIPRLTHLTIDDTLIQDNKSHWFKLCKNIYDKVRTHQMAKWLWNSKYHIASQQQSTANRLQLPVHIKNEVLSYLRCDDLVGAPANYGPPLTQECIDLIAQSSSSTPTAHPTTPETICILC